MPCTPSPAGPVAPPPESRPVPAGRCRRRWRCWSPSTWRSCGWRGAAAGTYRGPHPPHPSPGPARPGGAAPHLGLPHRWEPWEISITLHPATAQDQDSQYVRFTLVLSVPPQVGCRLPPPFPPAPFPPCSGSLCLPCCVLGVSFSFFFFSPPSIPTKLRKSRSGTRGGCQMNKFKSKC